MFDLLGILKDFLSKYSDTLHVSSTKFRVRVATGDAASTALGCAALKGAASLLFEFIDTYAIIDKGTYENVNIYPDFTSDKSDWDIEIVFRTRLWSLIRTLFTLFKEYVKQTVKREIALIEKGQQQ